MTEVLVEVATRKIVVPNRCPCCFGDADTAMAVSFTRVTGERVLRETTRELDFPYCSRCVEHARWWSLAWPAAAAVIGLGVLAAVAALSAGAAAGAGVAMIAAALALVTGMGLRTKAHAARCPSCAGAGPAVTYHGWVNQVQTFSFASRRYAAAFAEQNERSLVNVTPHVYQLVEQQRVEAAPPPEMPGARPAQMWPQRVDRGRALLDQVMIHGGAIQIDGLAKRTGRAS